MYSNYFVILYGTTQQWTQRIICKLDHLWYASGKIKRIECVKLIFNLDRKKEKKREKKVRLIFSSGVPQMIQFTYDKLSTL